MPERQFATCWRDLSRLSIKLTPPVTRPLTFPSPSPNSIHRRSITHHETEKTTHIDFSDSLPNEVYASNLNRYVITRPTEIMKVHRSRRERRRERGGGGGGKGGERIRRTRCTDRGRETNCVKGCGKGSRRRKGQVEAGRNGFTISHESLVTE